MQQLKIFACLLVIVATISSLHADSMFSIDDVEIYTNATHWKCDRIFCPDTSYLCLVMKYKLQPNARQVQRINKCYHRNNTLLMEGISHDPIAATENISFNATSYLNSGVWYSRMSSSPVDGVCLGV